MSLGGIYIFTEGAHGCCACAVPVPRGSWHYNATYHPGLQNKVVPRGTYLPKQSCDGSDLPFLVCMDSSSSKAKIKTSALSQSELGVPCSLFLPKYSITDRGARGGGAHKRNCQREV